MNERDTLAAILAKSRMTPYRDDKGGWLFRYSTPVEQADELLAASVRTNEASELTDVKRAIAQSIVREVRLETELAEARAVIAAVGAVLDELQREATALPHVNEYNYTRHGMDLSVTRLRAVLADSKDKS